MRRPLAVGGILTVLVISVGWYWLVGTPHYSLYRLRLAIEEKDLDTVEKYIDIDEVADTSVSTLTKEFREESKKELRGNPFGGLAEGFIALLEPQLRLAAREKLRQAFREGLDPTEGPVSGWKTASIVSVEREGKTAEVTLASEDGTQLRLGLRQSSDRRWRVVSIPSLADWLQDAKEELRAQTESTSSKRPSTTQSKPRRRGLSLSILRVSIANKRFVTQNYQRYLYWDTTFDPVGLKKPARAVKGTLEFTDLFGETMATVSWTINDSLKPGEPLVERGSGIKYNQFMDRHVWLKNTDVKDMKVRFRVKSILYEDGKRQDY